MDKWKDSMRRVIKSYLQHTYYNWLENVIGSKVRKQPRNNYPQ